MLPSYDTQTAYYNREHRLCDDSWRVNKCKAELFRPPRQHTSDTASFAFLNGDTNRGFINPNKFSGDLPTQYSHACFVGIYAFNLAVVLAYFTAIPFGYFKAVGLGVLPRVKDMGTQLQARHAVVLCLVFCITLIALYSVRRTAFQTMVARINYAAPHCNSTDVGRPVYFSRDISECHSKRSKALTANLHDLLSRTACI
eukprot:COSAG01_NODE_17_length_39991_cov_30.596160_37_plen_199_part_00